jgi:acetoin utilization deacetylase AcuC-like enzyme
VLSCRHPNGFGSTDVAIAATLPWTTGSLLSAGEHALSTGESAFSPTSGFHHAGRAYGAAFCTFNGLMVTALSLHARGLLESLAILDCDQHFGDGTRDIIDGAHAHWVRHYTYGEQPATRATAADWLSRLPDLVTRTASGADLVLYQAGADPHVDDPLGGGLSTGQMAARDRIVYKTCAALGVPVVTNLAGGYQRPVDRVVALHAQTLREFAAVHGFATH